MRATAEPRFHSPIERQALLLIMALATFARSYGANTEYWFDEIVVVLTQIRRPLLDVVSHYNTPGHHVMNAVFAHATVALWGEHPWAVRLPSILFGIAGVYAFDFLARQLWPRRLALVITLLFAVSYHHIYYTQNARGYSAYICFALLATGLLLYMQRTDLEDSDRRWVGPAYAAAVGLGLYALIATVFVVMGHASVLVVTRRWRPLAWLIAGVAFGTMLYAPMLADIVTFYLYGTYVIGQPILSLAFLRELRPVAPLLLIAVVAVPATLLHLAHRRRLAALLLVLPLVFQFAVVTAQGQGAHPRSFILALPLGYVCLAEGMHWVGSRQRWMQWAVAVTVLAVSGMQLFRYYQLPKQGFQQALAYIAVHQAPNDQRIGLTLGGKAARFYDPSVTLIEDSAQLQHWLETARQPTWVLYTFVGYLRDETPELYRWLLATTTPQAAFQGVIGDGTVFVRLWQPSPPGGTARERETERGQRVDSGHVAP